MTSPHLKDYLQLHFIVFIWGFTAILGELITSISRFELVFYRTLIAFLGLVVLFFYKKRSFQVSKKNLIKYLLTGGIIAVHWILFFLAMRVSTVSICLIGLATASLWTSLLEPIFYRKRPQLLDVLLGLLILGGLYIVSSAELHYALGLLLGVISALLGALFSVLNAQFIKKQHHYTITLYEMLGACLASACFLPFYWFNPINPQKIQLLPNYTEWFYLLILALVCTVYAYAASVKLMKKFTAFAVNLTVNLEPIYGMILAFFFFPERERQLSPSFYIGAVIIMIAVFSYPTLKKLLRKRNKTTPLKAVEVSN
ncbi:MAG: DMT family transporter [Thermonemataceae bacterium]